jgi:hypothetical protein
MIIYGVIRSFRSDRGIIAHYFCENRGYPLPYLTYITGPSRPNPRGRRQVHHRYKRPLTKHAIREDVVSFPSFVRFPRLARLQLYSEKTGPQLAQPRAPLLEFLYSANQTQCLTLKSAIRLNTGKTACPDGVDFLLSPGDQRFRPSRRPDRSPIRPDINQKHFDDRSSGDSGVRQHAGPANRQEPVGPRIGTVEI